MGDLCLAEGLPKVRDTELKKFIKMFDVNRDGKFEFEECLPMFDYISDLLARRKIKKEHTERSKFLKIKIPDIQEFITFLVHSYAHQKHDEMCPEELLTLLTDLAKDQDQPKPTPGQFET